MDALCGNSVPKYPLKQPTKRAKSTVTHSQKLSVYENARKRENKCVEPQAFTPYLHKCIVYRLDVGRFAYACLQMYVVACRCIHVCMHLVSSSTILHYVTILLLSIVPNGRNPGLRVLSLRVPWRTRRPPRPG